MGAKLLYRDEHVQHYNIQLWNSMIEYVLHRDLR